MEETEGMTTWAGSYDEGLGTLIVHEEGDAEESLSDAPRNYTFFDLVDRGLGLFRALGSPVKVLICRQIYNASLSVLAYVSDTAERAFLENHALERTYIRPAHRAGQMLLP
jgi:hypothetical protein